MANSFRIESGLIMYINVDKWWMLKKIKAFFTRKPYKRLFTHRIDVKVDSNRKLKVGDIFITGLSVPHPLFVVVKKEGNNRILAVSAKKSANMTPSVIGNCVVVSRASSEG